MPHKPPPSAAKLIELALGGLQQMYYPEQKIFCYRTELHNGALVKRGVSRTNTLITLIGLQKAERGGFPKPFDTDPAIKNAETTYGRLDRIGDIGLHFWLASFSPHIMAPVDSSEAYLIAGLSNCRDARERRTMELSWFLAGLSEYAIATENSIKLSGIAKQTLTLLLANQEASGLFRHSFPGRSISGFFRSRIASFADQVYPIYALSRCQVAFGFAESGISAGRCAEKLCSLQGPLGQWWWHYDAICGCVVRRYPVYSVHQDGMAPMALLALGQIAGKTHYKSIESSLAWIAGNNERSVDMRSERYSVIWRNLHLPEFQMYVEEGIHFATGYERRVSAKNLRVLLECRPYHLGWLLFAMTGYRS
jgi:hypothetical protein